MGEPIICPNCKAEDSIDWKYDAWARFQVIGIDAKGELVRGSEFDTQIFDHSEIECSSCGTVFDQYELERHLQKIGVNPEQQSN
jgi:hypothetical protein